MALLTADREKLWANFMDDLSNNRIATTLLKSDILAAVNAIDDWIDANSSNFNNSLPLATRTNLTAKQKAQLFMYVVSKRWEVT